MAAAVSRPFKSKMEIEIINLAFKLGWISDILNSTFFQSLVTMFVGIAAIFYANKIGKAQNIISDKLLNLNSSISLSLLPDITNKGLIFINNSENNNVFFYYFIIRHNDGKNVKEDKIYPHTSKGVIIPKSEMFFQIPNNKDEGYFFDKYFLMDGIGHKKIEIELHLQNSIRDKYKAIYNILLYNQELKGVITYNLQMIDYEKGW
ncbi:MAG: hypothetical protein WC794_01705 [Candidatus Doudnabacteria bacterium]